ncbi:hypothetical protein SDC9_175009 [bioreactor metagenome]|uniref:Uncharacterized protein n=1 Tax=bioreactor metagenome TaxID=1076179 RepID=A0A645GLH8_9ZZZZ
MFQRTVIDDLVSLSFPAFDLINASSQVLIDRDLQLIDQFRIILFDEVRMVLRIMLTGFGDIVAEVFHQFKAHRILMRIGDF